MRKTIVFMIFASLLIGAVASNAQGFRFRRVARPIGSYRCAPCNNGLCRQDRACSFLTCTSEFDGRIIPSPCESGYCAIPQACEAVQDIQAVPVEPLAPCEPATVLQETVEPCEAVQPVESVPPCAPTFEANAPEPCAGVQATDAQIYVGDFCPIARGALRSVASVPRAVARLVVETVAIARINAARARVGVAPVVLDDALCFDCKRHSAYMARIGRLQHASGVAEIIAQNNSGLEFAVDNQWARSSGHYRIMTSGAYTRCGLGFVRDANGRCWCVARFQ